MSAKVLEFRSAESPTIVYACSWCGFTRNDRDVAEECCRCADCGEMRKIGRTRCESCELKRRSEDAAIQRRRLLDLPILEEYDGPVFLYEHDEYCADTDAAHDYLHDYDLNPADAIVLPCTVSPVHTPCFEEILGERWGENSYDEWEWEPSEGLLEALTLAQRLAEKEAPEVWHYRLDARLVLAVV